MPLFDFRCRACGHEFEALVRPVQAAASARNKKAASVARQDNAALEREADHHRHEDH